MSEKKNKVMDEMMEKWEETLSLISNKILSNERLLNLIQTIIAKAITAKGRVNKNMEVVLNSLNLPTRKDIQKLYEHIDELDEKIAKLLKKLEEKQ
ncbi:MAG: phasin family protein [Deltaproteobacteria bacterium]|nr:phasin family protein [Deltaproteobacteria bacterium]